MRFEGRELSPWATYVSAEELRVGETYFVVSFLDKEMHVPSLSPVVFIGQDIEGSSSGVLYFQDYKSFREGRKLSDPPNRVAEGKQTGTILTLSVSDDATVHNFDQALEALLRCSLRRSQP
jgi:hypothetical protein